MSTLLRELDIWHLRWALRELHPADQRVPAIVLRLQRRLDERAGDQRMARLMGAK